jgi:hypothetical protein
MLPLTQTLYASDGWMMVNNVLEKDVEGSGRGLILRFSPGIFLEGLRKTTKYPSQNNLYPGRDLNLVSVNYNSLEQNCSVYYYCVVFEDVFTCDCKM